MESFGKSRNCMWGGASAPRSFHRFSPIAQLFVALLAAAIFMFASPAIAQETYEEPSQEIVVNLAAGRVVIFVAKDAILISTVENPLEAETRPPIPVQLGSERAGIFLGAVDWFSPATQQSLARLDRELPRLRRSTGGNGAAPHLQGTQGGGEATDIEAMGQGILERLNGLARNFHNKLDLHADEPLALVIVADYLPGYGPEVWQLSFATEQKLTEHEDYWSTRVLRPQYLQFWPPEKKEPKTLVEFNYPQNGGTTSILDLLKQKDPRIQAIVSSDVKMMGVADAVLRGESNKVPAVDAIQFLRAVLDVMTPPKARQTMASIGAETGFQWILQPPVEKPKPGEQKQHEPGAPSLLAPHPQN
jgi:hypothetical protein